MKLDHVVNVLLKSLKDDEYIEAVFLRGSIARDEHDEFSDIDMYCVVKEEHIEAFLPNRIKHINAYKKTLFVDDIYIIAPQLLVVYEDMVHIDLFTVTPNGISNKDANQLCLGIIASGIGFVLAQSTPFRFLDIRRRL
ncbi:nucleotidyltransferase domain-containing protein [Lysinibacillus xylanilyticus]|uniref:nucleotidyltransferase domain-containing protein n=1 Tax=Lysinibacillus xylanilyticus TaxID=582475 RepID=UPI00083C9725|nr:nucleotidyltransferase domain-containing protein [Lysinibacillus xylanilyticus]